MEESKRIRAALIEEKRLAKRQNEQRAREQARKKEEEAAKKKAEEEKKVRKALLDVDDLFEGTSRATTPLSRTGTPKPAGGEGMGKKKEVKKGLPTFRKPKMDDDVIASMDLGLEIDI